jgi:uncharacterized protein (DUF983 family)
MSPNQSPPRLATPRVPKRTSDTPLRMPTAKQLVTGVLRAFRFRCPHCGTGRVLGKFAMLRARCDVCGFRYERTDDNYFGGAVFFGLFCGELVVALTLLIVTLFTWPDVPWNGILYGVTIGSLAALPISLPFAKVVWLTVDTLVRPVQADELT